MRYVSIDLCRQEVFRYVYTFLTAFEPAPPYEDEKNGMAELGKVLLFVQDDQYYKTFAEKSAYILCSIAGSQYFSNGNKRLGIAVLLFFLTMNDATVEVFEEEGYRCFLSEFFPHAQWEHNANITDTHALFLYNLAIVIGDRHQWGGGGFERLKVHVTRLCEHLYRRG